MGVNFVRHIIEHQAQLKIKAHPLFLGNFTTAQRNLLPVPNNWVIYNTTLGVYEVYDRVAAAWIVLAPNPVPGPHRASHEPGGADLVRDIDILGTGVLLSAHRARHETGGADALTALDAGVITSGRFPQVRMPTDVINRFLRSQGVGVDPVYSALVAADIPAHASSHETGGADPLTALAASVITSGVFDLARIPNIDWARISGNFPRTIADLLLSTELQRGSDSTDASGDATVTFLTAFAAAPLVFLQGVDAGAKGIVLDVVSKSATQVVVKARKVTGITTSAVSAGTPAGSINLVSAGTPAGSIGYESSSLGSVWLVMGYVTKYAATTSGGACTSSFLAITSAPTSYTVALHHIHTFTGSALGTHNHTFTGSALGIHSHTVDALVLAINFDWLAIKA